MKKLVFGIFVVLIASLFGCNKNKQIKASISIPVNKTLNGYDYSRALKMIDNFYKLKDSDISNKSVSLWLSKEQINSIDTLLQSEAKADSGLTDGIRFYFGCDKPLSTTKLEVSILLVSTKKRTPPSAGLSTHGDYYNHIADFLSGSFGDVSDDSAPPGALLYDSNIPCSASDDTCNSSTSYHYLNCDTTYKWVQAHIKSDKNPINTRSEWFSLCFIHSINLALQNSANKLDGIRVYLGKGYLDKLSHTIRDVFILVPTYSSGNSHTDYYHCLEDLGQSICDSSYSHNKYFFFGGYDNGELCPNNCD
ncbi:MAG TPA: hypothetical protein VIM89_07390 [Mucilaginibacter sp.]